ncbi:nucleotide-diphospho-sugar transferase [Dactylonectria macrodidyma]|uniref:Nucleotide-diphospho-sugar transferase n=1 Tax=Dactylonectria macrodidyma TaxID=307937 RepID=A0A9P9F9Z7_9HYPO|nr:nucleotide-diphospho-sugar transferase [Dactylonectria macrodidyma]
MKNPEPDVPTTGQVAGLILFISLISFQYLRLLGNFVGFLWYRPIPIPNRPVVTRRDCTVIIPIINANSFFLQKTIRSILRNYPRTIILVTIGTRRRDRLRARVDSLRFDFPNTEVHIGAVPVANKRLQIARAIPRVRTGITILADDRVVWPCSFLSEALAPFDDTKVGGVGTNKCIRRNVADSKWVSFLESCQSMYLENLNYEIRGTYAIDGSVQVLGGETVLLRTETVQTHDFLEAFKNESFLFKWSGPFSSGDDSFITQWLLRHGWHIAIQSLSDACVELPPRPFSQFLDHIHRRERSLLRSSIDTLFHPTKMWMRHLWGAYAIHLWGIVHFSIVFDIGIVVSFALTGYGFKSPLFVGAPVTAVLLAKLVELLPVLIQYPSDILFLPGLLIFGYILDFFKLKALLTICKKQWGKHPVADLEEGAQDQLGWI